MRAVEATAGTNANAATDTSVGISRHERRLISTVMRVARGLWPAKTAYELQARTDLSLRQCERLTGEATGLSGETLRSLLHSEEGFAFLEGLMNSAGNAVPAWWEGFRYQVLAAETQAELAALRERQRQTRKKLIGLRSPRRT